MNTLSQTRAGAAPVVAKDCEVPGAVVVGGDYQGLAIVRSLGRRGLPVCTLDDQHCIARFSRYIRQHVRVEDLRDEHQTVELLLELGRRLHLQGWIIFPTREETVSACSRRKAELSAIFRVPTPGWETVQWAWDKRNTYKLAEELGIPIPATWYTKNVSELDEINLRFPVAIKPAIKEHFFYATKAKAWRANNRTELLDLFAKASEHVGNGEVMVQDLIPGDGSTQFAYCAFFKDGRSIGKMTVRRMRQHPSEFGRASTYVETVDVPELRRLSEIFLRRICYYGLVELEYKFDARDGQFKLLDVNARTWGYHGLGAAAGVDFPYMLFADQLGIPVEPREAVAGVKWIRLATDVPTAAVEVFRRTLGFKEYLRTLRGVRAEAVFCTDDIVPGLAELGLLPYLMVRRGF